MKERLLMISSMISLFGCMSSSDPRLNVDQDLETPRFTVSKLKGNCELRSYPAHLVASVEVSGDFDTASNRGFRALAEYIFGGNRSQASIQMTAPVSVGPTQSEAGELSEKIAMTTPVSIAERRAQSWEVTFSMPSKYTLETLPAPQDPSIKLYERSEERVAVIVFSGRAGQSDRARYEDQLRAWMREEGLIPSGPVVIARYNSPLTFPWNRRNELIIPVKFSL